MSKPTDYYAMIHADVLTERAILTVKAALNNGRFAAMNIWPVRPITIEQTTKGYNWLKKNLNRKCCAGLLPCDRETFGHFAYFRFDSFIQVNVSVMWPHYEPCYTVYSGDGSWFTYVYSGGNVLVLERGK